MKRLLLALSMLAGCGPGLTRIEALPDAPTTDAGGTVAFPPPSTEGGVVGVDGGPSTADGGPAPVTQLGVAQPPIVVVETLKPDAGWTLPPLQAELQEYELLMPDATLRAFKADVWTPEQPATFVYRGVSMPVMVELRGASSRYFDKKSWNVDLGTGRFEGRRRLNLVSEYQDSTMMAEKLAYDLLYALGVPAPAAKFVRLKVNGQYEGVFLDLEQVDKHFLRQHAFPDTDASIYRCGWKDCEMKTWKVPYQGDWAKKTNETEGREDLTAFLDAVNHTPEPAFAQAMEQRFDIDRYLRVMVMETLLSNNYVEDSESYFIHDRVQGKWHYVPWDLNNVDARFWPTYPLDDRPHVRHPLFGFTAWDGVVQKRYDSRVALYAGYLPVYSNLATRVVLNPHLRTRLLSHLDRALGELFTEEKMHERISQMHALISPHMTADPYIDQAKFQNGLPYLKGFVSGRLPVIHQQLPGFHAAPGVVIEAFDPVLGAVTLKNRGATAIELSGLALTAKLREPRQAVLPAELLPSGATVTYSAAQLGLTFPEKGEVGLAGAASLVDFRDLLFYGPLPVNQRYVRQANGEWTAQ